VEFCTVIAILLKDYSIELAPELGDGWRQTREKALLVVDGAESQLAMRSKNVKVRFVKRGAESFPSRL